MTVGPLSRPRSNGPRAAAHGASPRPIATWKVVAGVAVVLVAIAIAQMLDVGEYLRRAHGLVAGLGAWGPLAFVAIYVAVTLVAGPGLPFTLAAPVLFGPLPAFAIMVVASTLSAACAFLIARYLARDAVARRLEGNETFERIERLLDRHAFAIIPFVRIVPVPFAINNYGFGLTSISFWRYLLLSEIGMVPMNAVLVLGAGSALGASGSPMSWPLLALGGAAALVVVGVIVLGRRAWGRSES